MARVSSALLKKLPKKPSLSRNRATPSKTGSIVLFYYLLCILKFQILSKQKYAHLEKCTLAANGLTDEVGN